MAKIGEKLWKNDLSLMGLYSVAERLPDGSEYPLKPLWRDLWRSSSEQPDLQPTTDLELIAPIKFSEHLPGSFP